MTDVMQDDWTENKQDEIRRAKEEIAGPVPIIEDAPDTRLTLPRGLFIREAWQTKVTVREMTGTDEEKLAKTRDPSDFFDMVVALGVERLGDLDMSDMPLSERQGHLHRLLIGERDQIFLAVVKATYGVKRTLILTCQFCEEKQDLNLDLDADFPVEVSDNVKDESFGYTTSKGQWLNVRLAQGGDQVEVLARKGASLAEQNTILLSRCILDADGAVILDPMDFARNLSMRDRSALINELVSRQPRVDLNVTVSCVACGQEQEVALGWSDLFRTE